MLYVVLIALMIFSSEPPIHYTPHWLYWDCVPCRSVEPTLREGDLVIVKEVPQGEVEVGDIIASDTHHTDVHNQGLKAQFKSL